ncbi:MAG: hypothetical protein AAF567_15295 [Actinomycetota bacterium]
MTVAVEHHGSAAELHALPPPDRPELWTLRPAAPALVMGSAQRADQFDQSGLAAAGIDLAERRTGGGAVYIEPSGVAWVDVLAPRGSAFWDDDLAATFLRVGACWQRALVDLGVDAELVVDSPDRSDHARLACWAGLGWGEITLDGVKIVGLSQRRTRWGARVQAMAVLDGSADRVVDWFGSHVDPAVLREIREVIGSHPLPIDPRTLERAVIATLLDHAL